MWWRLPRGAFEAGKGKENEAAMRQLVEAGHLPGLLGYQADMPVAWVSVGPKQDFDYLRRARTLAATPGDDAGKWALTCIFVSKAARRQGLSRAMIQAAIAFAREQGAALLEAYPVDPPTTRYADAFANTGLLSAYLGCGFEEVRRVSPTKAIVQYSINP
jgi:GNAT superfamily N-acetyltransferase